MKKINFSFSMNVSFWAFLPLLGLNFLFSCDSPRSQRPVIPTTYSGPLNANSIPTVNLDNSNTVTTSAASASGTSALVTSAIPIDATQCKFSTDGVTGFESTSTHLGEYTLCQSSADKSIVYFQLKTPPSNANGDISICLIPTTSSTPGNSIYVGNPMCGYFKDPKSIRKINFIKYAQYANAVINGAIFFKDMSWYYPAFNNYVMTLDAYKTCMTMLSQGNSTYCQSFKSVGQYIYKQF